MKSLMSGKLIAFLYTISFQGISGAELPQKSGASAYDLREKEISLGIEEQNYYPHYGFENPDDPNPRRVGIIYDVLEEFSRKTGLRINYRPLPVERLHRHITNSGKNTVDLKYPANPQWRPDLKAGKTIYYSEPVFKYLDAVIVLVTPEEDLSKISLNSVATILGFTPFAISKDVDSGKVTLTRVKSIEQGLMQLFYKRIPGIYANLHVARAVARRLNLSPRTDQNKPTSQTFSLQASTAMDRDEGAYHFSSGKSPEIIKEINRFIRGNQIFLQNLRVKYGLDK